MFYIFANQILANGKDSFAKLSINVMFMLIPKNIDGLVLTEILTKMLMHNFNGIFAKADFKCMYQDACYAFEGMSSYNTSNMQNIWQYIYLIKQGDIMGDH